MDEKIYFAIVLVTAGAAGHGVTTLSSKTKQAALDNTTRRGASRGPCHARGVARSAASTPPSCTGSSARWAMQALPRRPGWGRAPGSRPRRREVDALRGWRPLRRGVGLLVVQRQAAHGTRRRHKLRWRRRKRRRRRRHRGHGPFAVAYNGDIVNALFLCS